MPTNEQRQYSSSTSSPTHARTEEEKAQWRRDFYAEMDTWNIPRPPVEQPESEPLLYPPPGRRHRIIGYMAYIGGLVFAISSTIFVVHWLVTGH